MNNEGSFVSNDAVGSLNSGVAQRSTASEDSIKQTVAALSEYFVGEATIGKTLERIAELTQQAMPQCMFIGLSMFVDGVMDTYVFTHPEVTDIDRKQYETGKGPCLDAFRRQTVERVDSTAHDARYPEFCAEARVHGVGSVLALPMATNHDSIGAMNLYAASDNAFSDTDAELGASFARQAAFLLVNARAYWDARTLSENLNEAMESRATIEQAKGIIMGGTGISADEAFQQLVRQSQRTNTKLRDVAAEVVRSVQGRHKK